jgi:hypothetical protein
MTLGAPDLPVSLDALIAEAKRRTTVRRLLVTTAALLIVGGIAAATVALRSASGGGSPASHHYTFTVGAVNASRLVNDTKYVSILSPVVLSRRKLARTPLFNITGAFHLTKASAKGSLLCSFAKKIADSTTFPNANGKTVRIRVYGGQSPSLTPRICKAFSTFSLSWLHYERLRDENRSNNS